MYSTPTKKQRNTKRRSKQHGRKVGMKWQNLYKKNHWGIMISGSDYKGPIDRVDENPSFSQGSKTRFQADSVGGKVSGRSWRRNKFPHLEETVESCNIENCLISSPMEKTFPGERRFEENRTPNLRVPNSHKRYRDGGARRRCGEHYSSIYDKYTSSPAHWCRHPRPFEEMPDRNFRKLVWQGRLGWGLNAPVKSQERAKNESQGQRDLHSAATHSKREQNIQTVKRNPGQSSKAIIDDYQRAELLLKSQKLYLNTDRVSPKVKAETLNMQRWTLQRKKNSIIIPGVMQKKKGKPKWIRPSARKNLVATPSTSLIQRDNLGKLDSEKQRHVQALTTASEGRVTGCLSSSIVPQKAELQDYVMREYDNHTRKILQSPHCINRNVHHPCYILDNIRIVMSFLSVLEVIRLKRVAKVWKIAVRSVLNKRTSDNITINPPSTAKMGGNLIRQLTLILPRLQSLTLSLTDFIDIQGPMPRFILHYVAQLQDLVFLRIESFTWRDFDMAVNEILPSLTKGDPCMGSLEVLELPDASLPIPTPTQCMKPLSQFTHILRSLMLNNAEDIVIFSIRLFMPRVKNLFLLNNLYTTQRFAQIIASLPTLMKHLTNDHLEDCPRTPIRYRNSADHRSKRAGPTITIGTPQRVLTPGRRPVTPTDERFAPLASRYNEPLCVEPLGSIYQFETGLELSQGMLKKFACFCALIGSLIIVPPLDDYLSHEDNETQANQEGVS